MNRSRVAVIFIIMILSVSCAYSKGGLVDTGRSNAQDIRECDIDAYIKKFQGDSERICIATIVAKRCDEVDACQFRCQLSGEWDKAGGGCQHMCSAGEEFVLPEGVEECRTQPSVKEAER